MTAPHPLATLELTLKQLLAEHRALLAALTAHETAIRGCRLDQIEKAARDQDAIRHKLVQTESRRRVQMHQLTRQLRAPTPPTLAKLAELYPERSKAITTLREELADVGRQIQKKSSLVARIAQSVLGHVNATLRLVAQATTGPGAYTRRGEAPIAMRIGVLNAVA